MLLLQGHAVSTIGDLMYSVAIAYWVYQATGSSSLMGVMSAVSMFVTMFLSPFAGSIVDKCNRKWVIVGVDLLQGIMMLTVGLLARFGSLSVPIVIAVAILAAFGSVIYSPAVSTLMIDIIPHEDMVRGQSVYAGAKTAIQLLGSAFSGAMVALIGVPLIVILNGMSNLYSALSEMFVRVPKTVQQDSGVTVKTVLQDTVIAIKTVFTNRFLCLFIPCSLILNLLAAGPMSLMLPFCIEKGFTVEMYGYLMAIYTAASLLGVVLLGVIKLRPQHRYVMLLVGFIGSIPCLVMGYLSKNFLPMCMIAAFASFLNCIGNTIFNSAMLLALPEENRGAILGFVDAASVGGCALSAVIYGVLGDIFPLYLVFTVGTLLTIVPMFIMCFSKRTKEFMLKN